MNMQSEVLKKAESIVNRLVLQYHEYVLLSEEIDRMKTEKLKLTAMLSKSHNTPMSEIAAHERDYPELADCLDRLALKERERDQVSDEMTFANPVVWIMYKDVAYKGTQQEIKDWAAFKDHCSPEDYICGKRFRFLEKYLKEKQGIELSNLFVDDMPLADIYKDQRIINLADDLTLMKFWQDNEYLRVGGVVNKWHTKLLEVEE